ncbi:Golgi transport protein GOT1-like protein [Galdieria sulphuraria]|uniref:Golgi transport protein GOT1-like protein n=1 Tax=Galdieria sulphuraria TaxID=130081 RepID=M2WS00_GALSU|nr:Golgi transport protein GOT1-like protein [Galdieria sulphuraria]EME26615.1 Golgi transport protein GOT1-like protein [Galdieria sulphuraria]|eukprot:XP_005703135.1 Golgi transport protein GOT1-like protein [Galdieria sulphuraria]
MDDSRKIGIGLTLFGFIFISLGAILFDSKLVSLGNLLLVSGIVLVIGYKRSFQFFFYRRRRAAFFFFVGLCLILLRWPIVGFLVEGFGMINLFGDFIPMLLLVARQTPFIGKVFYLPGVKQLLDRLGYSTTLPV